MMTANKKILATGSKRFIRRGDIFLVDFKKNQGSEQNGIRPALIVQNNVGNHFSSTTIVCPISSRQKMFAETHVHVLPEDCGVLVESDILCEQIRVIDKSRLLRKVGYVISPAVMQEVDRKTKLLLGHEG